MAVSARRVFERRLARTYQQAVRARALAEQMPELADEKLGGLACRIEVTQTWDDLVIADDIRDLRSSVSSKKSTR